MEWDERDALGEKFIFTVIIMNSAIILQTHTHEQMYS